MPSQFAQAPNPFAQPVSPSNNFAQVSAMKCCNNIITGLVKLGNAQAFFKPIPLLEESWAERLGWSLWASTWGHQSGFLNFALEAEIWGTPRKNQGAPKMPRLM